MKARALLNKIDFKKMGGIIPVVVQEEKTNKVLTLGFMNKEALKKTLKDGKVAYWSRVKKRIRIKGETSGHFQIIKDIWLDCDNDTLLIKVKQLGAACHTGKKSCFFQKIIKK